jgi:hypothetical protein
MALAEDMLAGILFGTTAIIIRSLQSVGAFSMVFWRLAVASLALAIMLLVLKWPFNFGLVRNNLKRLFVLSVFLGLHFVFLL